MSRQHRAHLEASAMLAAWGEPWTDAAGVAEFEEHLRRTKMSKAKRRAFLVALDMPDDMTDDDVREYIEEAVCCWLGGKDPQMPIYNLNRKSVTVSAVAKSKGNEEAHAALVATLEALRDSGVAPPWPESAIERWDRAVAQAEALLAALKGTGG